MERDGFHLRPNDEYNDLWFEFSNDSKGRIAFCDRHYEQFKDKGELSDSLSEELMQGIRRGWEREFRLNEWNQTKIDNYKQNFFNLKILKRIDNEEMVSN